MDNFTEFSSFRIADGIQVRREKFGLLFYDYRGPRIYFVPSKDFIGDEFFNGKRTIGQLMDSIQSEYHLPRQRIEGSLRTIFQTLEAKGLINGQPLC